jgi:hypothetical protein
MKIFSFDALDKVEDLDYTNPNDATDHMVDNPNDPVGLQMIRLIDKTEIPAIVDEDRPKEFGKRLGKIFTKFFNFQVPDIQYQSYV